MKTRRDRLAVIQVNYAFDRSLRDPEALLERYATLTGWADALVAAGAGRSAVVQEFHRAARIVRNGVEYHFVARGVAPAVAALTPDLAHVNGLAFAARTWRLRRSLPAASAIVVQNHSDTGPMGRAPLARLIGAAARGAVDAFLFAADEHASRWREAGFVGAGQPTFQVMEASTAVAPIARAEAREITGVRGAPALLWVGRLNGNKDPLTIVEAFERALQALPHATLTMIYTADDLIGAVRASIDRSAALRERVRLVGAVPHDHIVRFLSAADLFVVGSHHEGSGYALIEALACGVPPAVTDIPSFRVLTAGGTVGTLWRPGDPAGCAAAIVSLANADPDAARAAVRDYFERHFSWPAIGRRAMEIYARVVRARRAAIKIEQ
ncbi:MAG TPA: glycosyltransferase family 4 protein [Vicinamibacterales bacterium]|nr:glycosyltransferase family 4 protein [Vicinamibacterales bacterium]